MIRKELIRRSPLRILEKSTKGGVQKGNIGVIAARKGVGKTACLVHIATDQLLLGKHIIHISFAENTNYIIAWYEDIFREIAGRFNLDDALLVHDEIVKNRIIMNFSQAEIHIEEIKKSVARLIEKGNFSADTVVIDGYDFSASSQRELEAFKQFASELGLSLWFSATVKDGAEQFDGSSIPAQLSKFASEISLIICLQPKGDYINLNLVKDHGHDIPFDPHLKLDPKILLIADENQYN